MGMTVLVVGKTHFRFFNFLEKITFFYLCERGAKPFTKLIFTQILQSFFIYLQNHEWLKGVETDDIDIAEWVTSISQIPTSPQA